MAGNTRVVRNLYRDSVSLMQLSAALGTSFDGGNLMQVLSRTNANFSLLRSTNMIHWSPILTTNSPSGVYNHADPKPPASIRYFYRAQLLP